MKDSLRWFLGKFPFFLDKNAGSNFYRSSSVINDGFKDFRQDLFNTHLSHRLEKRVLIWKEQDVEYDYTMNFFVHLPYLKMVNVFKGDELIYTESYDYEDEVNTFIYSYDASSNKVIPSDKYRVTVETWDEYVMSKGFPENDEAVDDIFDHDKSLDELGALYDIPRKRYVYTESTNPGNTEPPYNNRTTEDDYHYMNRLLFYINHLQDTPLPVLEVWKLFGIPLDKISLINRERYLCKMYSAVKHDGDNWTPKPWEHKDTMSCFWPEPVFFFVEVDNHSPVSGQSIHFSFTFLNMYGEDKGKDYLIDVYLDDTLIDENVDPFTVYDFSTKGVDDTYPLVFKFVAKPLDTRYEVLESDEIIINIKGCESADWYVATDGNDSNAGTKDNPFKTLHKALSMVEGSRNVIVLKQGTYPSTVMEIIDDSTSIISCQGAVIRNDNTYDFFRVLQGYSLYLQGVTLKHKCCEMYAEDTSFVNSNLTDNPLYLRINPDVMCKPPVLLRIDSLTDNIYAHRNFTIESTLLDEETMEGVPDETIELIKDNSVVATVDTDENGEFSFTGRLDSVGVHSFVLNHNESRKYCMGDNSFNVTVEAMPTILTATIDTTVLIGEELTVAFDLVDYYGDPVTYGYIKLLEEGIEVARVPADEEIEYTPSEVGDYDYKLVFEPADDTYLASESLTFFVTVRQYRTNLLLDCDTEVCYPSDTVTFNGLLTDERDSPVSGASVYFYHNNLVVSTLTTDSNGRVTESGTYAKGRHTFQLEYDGDSKYVASTSGKYNLKVKDDNPTLFLELSAEDYYVDSDTVELTVRATDSNGDPVANTGFKLIDSSMDSCTSLPSTSYTTDGNGVWTGDYSNELLEYCGGLFIQAVSTVDSDVVSNTIHVYGSGRYPTSLTFSSSKASVVTGETFVLSGRLDTMSVTGLPVKIYKGNSLLTTVYAGSDGSFSYNRIESNIGSVSFKAVFDGDNEHVPCESSSVSVSVVEPSHEYSLSIASDKTSILTTESVTVYGTLLRDGVGFGGQTVTVYDGVTSLGSCTTDSNGDYSKTITGLSYGTHSLKAVNSNAESTTVSVSVDYPVVLSTSDVTMEYYDGTEFIATVTKNGQPYGVGEYMVMVFDGLNNSVLIGNDGKARLAVTDTVGVYTVVSSFEDLSNTNTVVVDKASTVTSLSASSASITVGDSLTLSGSVSGGHVGVSSVKLFDGSSLLDTLSTDSNGSFSTVLTGLSAGSHGFQVVFDGDSNHEESESLTVNVNVNHNYQVLADNVTKYDGGSERFVVTVLEDGSPLENASVTITLNGVTISRTTDSNGECSIAINSPPYIPGEYPVSVTCEGVTVSKTITVLPVVIGSDVSKYEHGVEVFTASILDTNGDPVSSGTSVNVNMGGTTTAYTTDSNGEITVPLNQAPGEYTVTVSYGSYYPYTVTVLPRLIASDLTVYEHCGDYSGNDFTVEVLTATGESVPDGTQVTFNINGVDYTRVTVNGISKISINLLRGTYPVTISYSNVTPITNTVTVLPKLFTENKTVTYPNPIGFVATALDCQGNTVSAGETIYFDIGGALYNRSTDSNGQATLNITLQPNTYTIVSSYGGASTSNTITVTPSTGLVFSSSVNKQSIITGETCRFTAWLENNSVPIPDETIQYEITDSNDTVLDSGSFTTNSGGSGGVDYTGTGAGTVTCTFTWGSLSTSKSVEDSSHDYSLSVTGTKDILSYADSESATVTATLTDNSVAVAGETLSYVIKHGATTIDSGTDTTDSNGEISFTYASTGVGDVTIEVDYSSLLQETYTIEDCYWYDPQTTDKGHYVAQSGSANISYDNNGCTISASTTNQILFVRNVDLTLPTEYEASFKITACSGDTSSTKGYAYCGIVLDDWFTDWYSNNNNSDTYKLSTTTKLSSGLKNITANDVIKVVRENNTMKLYINDVLISTDNNISHTGYFEHRTYHRSGYTARSLTVKDLKVKAL